MTDTSSPNPSASDGKEGTSGAADATKDKDGSKGNSFEKSEQAWNDLIQSRNDAKTGERKTKEEFDRFRETTDAELKQLRAQLKAIEGKERSAAEEAASRANDIEKVREIHKQAIGEKDTQIAELQGKLADAEKKLETFKKEVKSSNLRRHAMAAIAQVSNDPEVALKALFDVDNEFEEATDKHGNPVFRVRDSDEEPVSYMRKKLEKLGKSHLLKSERLPGTGAQPNTGDPKGTGEMLTREQIKALPDGGKEYFRKNPAAAAAYLAGNRLNK